MKRLFPILSLAIFFLAIYGCSKKNDNPMSVQEIDIETISKSVEKQEAYLSILAQQLAVSFNDQVIADFLKKEFETTNNCEKILNFSDLLPKEVDGLAFIKKITSANLKADYNLESVLTEREIEGLVSSFVSGMDLYFPLEEHSALWKSNVIKILIAYPSLSIDENNCEKILAYTIAGKEKELSGYFYNYYDVKILDKEKINLYNKAYTISNNRSKICQKQVLIKFYCLRLNVKNLNV